MSWWKSERGIIGDEVRSILDKAFEDVMDVYQKSVHRHPTQGELADLVEFTTGGILRATCGCPSERVTPASSCACDTARAAPADAQGPARRPAPFGVTAFVDPETEDYIEVKSDAPEEVKPAEPVDVAEHNAPPGYAVLTDDDDDDDDDDYDDYDDDDDDDDDDGYGDDDDDGEGAPCYENSPSNAYDDDDDFLGDSDDW